MLKYIYLSTLSLFLSVQSFAQEIIKKNNLANENATLLNKKRKILNEVIIITRQKNDATALRSGIKPMDLPQSIQIIGSAVIEQQQSIRLSDVIKNANGVYVSSARGGAQESFYSRGYDMTANNMFKNGFRFNSGSIPEVASLEKIEILKGSSALLYGNVTPGGILNMVTKTPLFKKGMELSMQAGSYNFYKPHIDFYGSLGRSVAYRFIGTYENSESFRNVVKKERCYVNPSLLFKINNKTEIIIQGDYLNDYWTPDFGTGSIGRNVAEIPRNTYLGARWSNGNTKQASASALINYQFNTKWKFNFNSSYQNYKRISEGTERILPAANGDWNRPLGKNKAVEEIYNQQLSLQGNISIGKVKNQLFTGMDIENSFADAFTFVFNPANYDLVNIYNLDLYPQGTIIPQATNTKIVKTETNRYGIYAQDLISFSNKFKVLAGIRYSIQETKPITYDLVATTVVDETIRNDRAFSPKIGLIYQPTKNTTLFTSYSNSFTPNIGLTIFNEALKPSIIDQIEVGAKKEFWKGILSTNFTYYQIVNSDLAQTAEFNSDGTINTNTNIKSLSGETTSKGIEVDIVLKPLENLNIMAGYSFNNMEYSKTTGAKGSFIEGERLVRTPKNTTNISAFYTISKGKLKGISVGTIANYIGSRLGGYNNTNGQTVADRTIPLEGYTMIDFSLGYNWRKFSVLCKLSNISNELNYTVHENYSINPIAPRQVFTTLKYKF